MKTGFTLMETIVVVLIISVLIGVALPNYTVAVEKARMTEVLTLWGPYKGFATGASLSPERAEQINDKLAQARLKYFTAELVCRPKADAEEKCWEAVFRQKSDSRSARYTLTTVQNFRFLACYGLNGAGERFCSAQAQGEPLQIDGHEAYIIR